MASFRNSKFQFPLHKFTTLHILNTLFVLFSLLVLAMGGTIAAFALAWMYPSFTPLSNFASALSSPSTPSIDSPLPSPTSSLANNTGGTVSFLNLVLTPLDIYSGLILGTTLISSFILSIPSLISRSTRILTFLNLFISFDILATIACGGIVWFRSLRTRSTFSAVWDGASDVVRGGIQDRWECCGYWSVHAGFVKSNACPSLELALSEAKPACVDPFTDYAGGLLGGVSTFMYGVSGVLAIWLVLSGCIIAERNLRKRFVLIDLKREKEGGGAFV